MTALDTKRISRMAVLCLIVAFLIVVASLLLTAARLRQREGDGTASVRPLGIPMFSAEREGNTSQLNPGAGVLLVLVGLPALGAGTMLFQARNR